MKKYISLLLIALFCLLLGFRTSIDSPTIPDTSETSSATASTTSHENKDDVENSRLTLEYDDRYEFNKEIASIQNETSSSRQVGSEQLDMHVLKKSSNSNTKVVAVGCGRATVVFEDGSKLQVYVESAPISLLLIVGQSNGEGRPSSRSQLDEFQKQWVLNSEGTVYSTYGPSDNRTRMDMYEEVSWYKDTENVGALSVSNAHQFLPKSLTDNGENNNYNSTNKLTDAKSAIGKGGIDSALAYRWRQLTGEKVWIINACHHGTSIKKWDPNDSTKENEFWQAVTLYRGAEEILSKEIESGHYTLAHKGIFWYQGESDYGIGDQYAPLFLEMNEAFMQELDGHGLPGMEKEIEFTGILMVRATLDQPTSSNDFYLTGPRRVLFNLAVNPEYPTILMASQIEEEWTSDDAVNTYFQTKYPSQKIYETTLPLIGGPAQMPTNINDVHSQVHYMQLAYNEIGIDAAENICYALQYAKAPQTKIDRIEVVSEDGMIIRNGKTLPIGTETELKIAVKVYPAHLAKTVKVDCSDAFTYSLSGISSENPDINQVYVQVTNDSVYYLENGGNTSSSSYTV